MELKVGKTRGEEKKGSMEMIRQLEEENQELKKENEILLGTIRQMKITLNRLINRYVIEKPKH